MKAEKKLLIRVYVPRLDEFQYRLLVGSETEMKLGSDIESVEVTSEQLDAFFKGKK